MRFRLAFAGLAALGVLACGAGETGPHRVGTDEPAATPSPEMRRLQPRDVRLYVAVRERALERMERTIDGLPSVPDEAAVARFEDLTGAERAAVDSLGVRWGDYLWVRERIARLITTQRQREDARILSLELSRTRKDLADQLGQARDEASRQFLNAQIQSLDSRLAELEAGKRVPGDEARELSLIEDERADLATLQGREDRLEKRIRDLLRAARAARVPTTPPARPTAKPAG